MAEIMKEKAGKGNDHEENHERAGPGPAPKGFSKWKSLAAAVGLATAVASGQAGCGSNPDTVVGIPDGGTCTDGDAQCDGGTGGHDGGQGGMDGGTGGMDGGSGGMDAGMGGHDGGTGGMDAGTGGMDAGMGGMDGGVSDGGGGMDAGPVACGAATTGSFSGFMSLMSSPVVGGYKFSYGGVSGGDALVSISCSGNTVETNYHCPIGSTTDIDVTVDHKQIQIHVSSANSSNANVNINVVNH